MHLSSVDRVYAQESSLNFSLHLSVTPSGRCIYLSVFIFFSVLTSSMCVHVARMRPELKFCSVSLVDLELVYTVAIAAKSLAQNTYLSCVIKNMSGD